MVWFVFILLPLLSIAVTAVIHQTVLKLGKLRNKMQTVVLTDNPFTKCPCSNFVCTVMCLRKW